MNTNAAQPNRNSQPAPASVRAVPAPAPMTTAQRLALAEKAATELRAQMEREAQEAAEAARAAAEKNMTPEARMLEQLLSKVTDLEHQIAGFGAMKRGPGRPRTRTPAVNAPRPAKRAEPAGTERDYEGTAMEDIRALLELMGAVRVADVVDANIHNHLGNPCTEPNIRRFLEILESRKQAFLGREKAPSGKWRYVWASSPENLSKALAGKLPTPTDAKRAAKN